ncbi:hypothetical protein IJU22_01830 [Candidatus Saccharibacteria bacterium]|nr:hypothetical protein [Candidatus Saccharibacteria bacterium]
MFELVISTKNGQRYQVVVRDAREADHELARFENVYLAKNPADAIWDASVLDRNGNRVSRYTMGGFESF